MNWNLIGRITTLANLALSLGFAYWAFGLYANHVDFTSKKSGETAGQFARRNEEFTRLKEARARAEGRWNVAFTTLAAEEEKIPGIRAWWAKHLLDMQNSPTEPIKDLQYVNGQLKVDARGIPELGPVLDGAGQPIPGLASLAVLQKQYEERQTEIAAVSKEVDQLVEQLKKLTGTVGDGKEGNSGGLRATLAAVQKEVKKSEDEQEYLKPLLYNRQVEAQLLASRHKALESRLKELQSVPVARQP